ncbi:MAG TPA: homocysteine S-methyltransferase family protein [Ignavibacteriaceae bacterium]|nr:homocysteine S-methyltransferase family protein [Ignavibacteriaceae bacterium]
MIDIQTLLKRTPILFDGAMGTELQKKGLEVGHAPELLNIENPEVIKSIHLDYLNAGSSVIETNSFGANAKRLELSGLQERVFELNFQAAKIAKELKRENTFVAGSMGPLGVVIEPFGDIAKDEAKEIFKVQADALIKGGIDFILVETMIFLEEAITALKAAKEAGAKTVGVSLTFEVNGDEIRTPFGDSLIDCIEKLQDEGASFIGSNCGNGFDQMETIAATLKENSHIPILVQPNAGLPHLTDGIMVYDEKPEAFAEFALFAKSLGVEFIGGCCGTNKDHINAAAKLLGLI